jgi:hypothetical protein
MPTLNIYSQNESHDSRIIEITIPLKEFAAEQLTCGDRKLASNEVTVRLLRSLGKDMLADVEIDITAAPYQERIDRQDEICLNVKRFVLEQMPGLEDTNVWLNLNELGHSWED